MKLEPNELEYLSAWAREERAQDPYALPAHRLQATHHVRGIVLIRLIKAWARGENRHDEDIFALGKESNPVWPWPPDHDFAKELDQLVVPKAS